MSRFVRLGAVLAFLIVGRAPAEPLYHQDFQAGVAPEWAASGDGDVRLSAYAGNVTIKVAGHARSRTVISTAGRRAVVLRFVIAAQGLTGDDACYAEASADSGSTWLTALAVRKGQDDGVTLIGGAFGDPSLDDRRQVILRFRADLSRPDAACWGDNVDVEAAGLAPMRAARFTAADLAGPGALAGLTPIAGFLPGATAGPPAAPLRGRLSLRPAGRPDGLAVVRDAHPVAGPDPRLQWPKLDVDLVSDGDRVIPVQRGPIPSPNPEWNWVIEPGRTWVDPADGGATRLVLPVALEERNANCLHTGRLLVLVGPGGAVPRAAVQIDAETCAYHQFDAWSLVPAAFSPGAVAGADAVVARDRAERLRRPALRSLAALGADHPGADPIALARAAGPSAVFGVFDGEYHYASGCPTRVGEDPFCAERPLPSYSTAKSLVAAQALFRLQALRPGVIDEKVADHVTACAARGGWGDVRLIDLLDMASGHYVSSADEADEDSPATVPFFRSTTEAEKVAFACDMPRKARPGRVWVYHTFDTFLLGAAMTDVMRKSGLGRDLYSDLIGPIWAAAGQSPDLDDTRRTQDAAAQPFTGWGLVFHRDDVLRAARFMAGDAAVGGKAYLDRGLLDEALQRAEPGGGFEAIAPLLRYRHGVWARDVAPMVGCKRPVWTPYMSGYGGISIVMFPNGVIFYAFNDENHFDWGAAIPVVDHIRKLCP